MDTSRPSTKLSDLIKDLEAQFASLKAHVNLTEQEKAELERDERIQAAYERKLQDGNYHI